MTSVVFYSVVTHILFQIRKDLAMKMFLFPDKTVFFSPPNSLSVKRWLHGSTYKLEKHPK